MQRANLVRSRRTSNLARGMLAMSAGAMLAMLPAPSDAQTLSTPFASTSMTLVRSDAGGVRQGWLSPRFAEQERIAGLLYVSYAGSNSILIFSRSIPNQLLGQLTAGLCIPTGIAVDARHRVYVDNFNGGCGASVSIFRQGVSAPDTIIGDGLYDPVTVAVSAKDGTIYAADAVGHNILEYAHGKKTVKDIVYPAGGGPFSVALDSNDVLYASYTDASAKPRVGRYDPATRSFVDLGIPLVLVGPIVFDAANNLLVGDQRTGIVSVYAPGTTTPLRTYAGFSDPFAMTLDAENNVLYVADLGHRTIEELSYPSGKKLGLIGGFAYNTFGVAVTSPTKRGG